MSKALSNDFWLNNNLRVFLLLCNLRNFSKVASVLGVTQSSVSKSIAKLENELGFTLFLRDTRPLTLTIEAKVLQHQLQSITGDIAQTFRLLQSENFIKPELHLGIVESLAANFAPLITKTELSNFSKLFFSIIYFKCIATKTFREKTRCHHCERSLPVHEFSLKTLAVRRTFDFAYSPFNVRASLRALELGSSEPLWSSYDQLLARKRRR